MKEHLGAFFAAQKKADSDGNLKYAMKISSKEYIRDSMCECEMLKDLSRSKFTAKLVYAFQDPHATYLCMDLYVLCDDYRCCML